MYKIVHYGDQPERTWALLNSYRSKHTHFLRGTLNSYKKTMFERIQKKVDLSPISITMSDIL